ncbi:microtubule-associated protein futsch-like [Penaeus japonicus]|uniref:microtubule-associated protein futsch-like n=1 Tax=Penaeus japonicus TaxID=27405 RepID=UPI001C714461|nr:microtubule-associated protein futsch-like [Penaeus japonicus]
MEGKAKWRKLKRVVGPTSPGTQQPPGKQQVRKERIKTRDAKRRKMGEGDEEEEETETAMKVNGEHGKAMKEGIEGIGGLVDEGITSFQDGTNGLSRDNGAVDSLKEANGDEGQGKVQTPRVLVTDLDKDFEAATVECIQEPQTMGETAKVEYFHGGETGVASQTQESESSVTTSSSKSDRKKHKKTSKKSGDVSNNDKPVKFFISDEESDSDTAIFVDANQPTPNGENHNVMDQTTDARVDGQDPGIEISAEVDVRGESTVELTFESGDVELGIENVGEESFDMSKNGGPVTTQLVDVDSTDEPHLYEIQRAKYKSSMKQPGRTETRKVKIQPKPETVSKSSTSESLDVDSVSKSSVSDLIDQESYSRTTTTETSRTSTVESQDADTVSISSATESTEHETLSKVSTTESGEQETITISTTESTEGTSKTSTAESVGTISKSSTVGSMEGESKSSSSESGEQYMSKTSTTGSVSKTTTSEYEEAESVSRTSASETASRTSGTSRTTTTTESGEPTGSSRTATESVTSASETGEYISKSISSSTDFDAESLSSTADLLTPKEEPPFPLGMKAEAEPGEQVKIESSPEILLDTQMEKPKDELEVRPGSPSWKKLDVEDQLRLASKTEIPESMPADAMKDRKDADAESLFFSLYPEYQPGESQESKDGISAGNPKVLCFRGQTPDQGERHEEVYMAKEKEAGGKDGRINGAVSGKIQQLQRKLSQQKKPERETKEIFESEGSPTQPRGTSDADQVGISFDEQQATTPGNGDDAKGDFDRKEFPDHTTPGGPLPDVLDRSTTIGTGIDAKEIQYTISSAKDDLVRTVGKLGERIEGLADSVEIVAGVVSDVVQNASGQADVGHESMTETGQEAIEGEGKSENNMKDRKTLVGKARDWIKGVARIGSKKEDTAEKAAEREREAAKFDAKKAETPSENGTDETSSVKSKSSLTKETPNGEERPLGTEEEGAVAESQKMPGTPPKEDEISQISREERISVSGDNGIPGVTPEEITEDANHVSDKGSTNGNGKQDDYAAEEKPMGEEAAEAMVTLEEELMKAEDEIIQQIDVSGDKGTGQISPIKEAGSPEKEVATAVRIETLGADEEKPDSGPKEGEAEQTESKEEQAEGEAKEEITDGQGKEAAAESQEAAEGTEEAEASKEKKEREEAGKEEGAAEEPTKGKDELKPRRKRREKSKSPSVRRDREGKDRKEKDKDKDKDGKGSVRKRRHRRRTKSQEEPGEPGLLQATEVLDAEAAQVEGITVQPSEISKESEVSKEAEAAQEADVHELEVKQEVGFAQETEIIGESEAIQEPEISQDVVKETETGQKPEDIEPAVVKEPEIIAEPIVIKEVDAKSASVEAEAKEESDASKEAVDAQAEAEKLLEALETTGETVTDASFKLEIGETVEAEAAAVSQEIKKEETEVETAKKDEAADEATGKEEQAEETTKKDDGTEEKHVDKVDSKEAELGTAKKVDSADEKKEKGSESDQPPGPDETPTTTRRRKDSARSHKDKFSDEFWKDKLSSGQKKHSFGSGDYSGVDIKRPSKFKREKSEEPKEEKQDTEESEKAAKAEEKPQEEETQTPKETPEAGDAEGGEVHGSVTAAATSWSPRVSRRERKSSRRSGEHKRESRSTSKSKSSKEKKHQESEGVTTKTGEDATSVGSPKSLKKKKKKSEAPGSPKEGSAPEPKPRTRHSKPESPLTKKTPTMDQLAADSAPVLQELKFPEGISKPVSPSPVIQTLKFPEGISQPLSPTPEKIKPSVTIPKPTPEAQPLSPLKPLKFPEGISQPISPIMPKVKPPPFKPTQETTKEEVAQPVSPTSKTAKSPEVLSPSPKELKFPEGVSMPRSPTPQELKFPEGISKPLSPSPKELKFPVGVSKPLSPSPKELKFPEGIAKPLSPSPRELKFPEGISKPLSPSPREAKLPETQLSPSPKELTFPEGISKPLSPSPKEVPKPFSPLPQELKFPEGVTKPLSPAIIAGKMPEPKPLKERKKERPRVIIPKTLEPAIEPMKPISPMKTLKFPEGVTKPISPMKTRVVSDLKPSSPTSETKKPMSPLKPLKFPEGISKPISPLPPKAIFKPVSSVAKPPSPTLDEAPKPVTSVDKATATEPPKTKASQTLTKLEFPEGVSVPVSPTPAKAKSLASRVKTDMKTEMQKRDLADADMKKSETSKTEVSSPLLTALQFPEGISKPLSPVPPGPKPIEKKASTPDEPPTPPLPSTLPPELPKAPAEGIKPVFITTTAPETPPIQTLTFPEGVSVPISPIPKSVKPTTSSPLTKPSSPLHKVTSPQPKVSSTASTTQKPASPKLTKKSEFPKSILSTKHRSDSVKSPDATSKTVAESDQVSSDTSTQPPASKPSPEEKPLTTGERISRAVASIGLTRSSEGRTTSKFSRSDSLRSSQKRTESQEGARPQQDDSQAKDGSESPHAGAESPSKRLRRRKKR